MSRKYSSANFLSNFQLWIFVTACATISVFLFTDLPHILLMTFIFSPVAIFLLMAPGLLFTLGCMWIASKLLQPDFWPKSIGALIALLTMTLPPYYLNAMQDNEVRNLMADDTVQPLELPSFQTVALNFQRISGGQSDDLNCEGLCMRLLLNGTAKKVLVMERVAIDAIDTNSEFDSFQLENRLVCPIVKLPKQIDFDWNSSGKKQISVEQRMQAAVSKGTCLIHGKVKLDTADVILSHYGVRYGNEPYTARLNLKADTISAERVSVHKKSTSGFKELYRKTAVRQYRLPPLLFATSVKAQINVPFAPLVSGFGFPRNQVDWNNENDMFLTIGMRDLVDAIDLNIALPGE